MTKRKLLIELRKLQKDNSDPERNHGEADKLLLEYINSPLVDKEYSNIKMY